MKTIDLTKKLNIDGLADKNHNYTKKHGQDFYENPTSTMIHLVELLPNGDYWFAKSWRKSSILLFF